MCGLRQHWFCRFKLWLNTEVVPFSWFRPCSFTVCRSTVLLLPKHSCSQKWNGGAGEVKASGYSVPCDIPPLLLLSFNIQNQLWAKVNVNSPGCQGPSGAPVFPHPCAAQRGIPGMRQWHWSLAAQRHFPLSPLSSAILMILAWE